MYSSIIILCHGTSLIASFGIDLLKKSLPASIVVLALRHWFDTSLILVSNHGHYKTDAMTFIFNAFQTLLQY